MTTDKTFVVVALGDEEFAIEVDSAREIINLPDIHPVPQSPGFLEGVINIRHALVAVINLRKKLGLEVSEYTDKAKVVIVKAGKMIIGIIVDVVEEVLSIPQSLVKPISGITNYSIDSKYISAIARVHDRVIFILNLEKILSDDEAGQLVDAVVKKD